MNVAATAPHAVPWLVALVITAAYWFTLLRRWDAITSSCPRARAEAEFHADLRYWVDNLDRFKQAADNDRSAPAPTSPSPE